MLTIDIATYIKDKSQLVEQRLDALIPEIDTPYAKLFSAARYALLGSGKKLRPILALATAETCGDQAEHALTAACALEMIHAYSLIHDDLPCMDDDDFRRGKPSLHKAFGEGHAVLTGDYLLTYAFEVVADDPTLTSAQKVSLIKLLAHNAGAYGMVGGQVMDIQAENQSISLETLKEIHRCKTGALITASILCGGIVAGASESELAILAKFGDEIGLAFQIVDDVIDVISSEQKHGKKISSDAANHKTTYVTLLGVDGAKHAADALYTSSLQHLKKLPYDSTLLHALADRLIHRKL